MCNYCKEAGHKELNCIFYETDLIEPLKRKMVLKRKLKDI